MPARIKTIAAAPMAIHCQGVFCDCLRLFDFEEYRLDWASFLGAPEELLDCCREAGFPDLDLFFDFFEPLMIDSLSMGV